MFGKKREQIKGQWGTETAKYLSLQADNFLLNIQKELSEKQISMKGLEKYVCSFVHDIAESVWAASGHHWQKEIDEAKRENYGPFSNYSTTKKFIVPCDKNGIPTYKLDLDGNLVPNEEIKQPKNPPARPKIKEVKEGVVS